MPRAYCPRCDTAYHATTITDNSPVCDDCMTHGDVVVLLPSTRRRFSRATVNASDRGDNARSVSTSTEPRVTSVASDAHRDRGRADGGLPTRALAARRGADRRCALCGQALRAAQQLTLVHGSAVHDRCTRARPVDRAPS